MRFKINRRAFRFFFCEFRTPNESNRGPGMHTYMSLVYGNHSPEEQWVTGYVCCTARLAGKMWVMWGQSAPPTRRTQHGAHVYMMLYAKYSDWLQHAELRWLPMHMMDKITTATELDLCDLE